MASDWSDPEVRTGEVTVEAERVRGERKEGRGATFSSTQLTVAPSQQCPLGNDFRNSIDIISLEV